MTTHHPDIATAHPVYPGDTCAYGVVTAVNCHTVQSTDGKWSTATQRNWLGPWGEHSQLYTLMNDEDR